MSVACARTTGACPPRAGRVTGADASGPRTLGVEEEFHVVDLGTRRASARGPELLAHLPNPSFVAELQRSIVETNTLPCITLDDLRRDVLRQRHRLITTAEQIGLGVLAAGSPPLADPDELDITAKLRYAVMLADYERLAREQVICGCQVHVGIDDRDLAVAVARRVSADLPVLLAMSASSPFWHAGETGYASFRTMVWARWPTSGPFPAVADAAGYALLVEDLIATGVISDPGMIYYDVRPSAHVPTLELRLCDACPRVDDVVLIAGLFRALTSRAITEIIAGRPLTSPPPGVELLRAATWRAARSGLASELVDPATLRPTSATELLARLVAKLRPELEAAGDWETVSGLAAELAASGGSATRQRAALRRAGSMEDVVDLLLTETRGASEPLAGANPRVETSGLLVDYPSARTDEAMPTRGGPHVLSSGVLSILDRLGSQVLSRRQQASARHQLEQDVTFAVAGETRPFPIDLVPRVVGGGDWHEVARGVEQRAVALEMFLRDVYGRRAVVRDGVLPESMVESSAAMRPAGALVPEGTVRACVVGVDVVRDAAGAWRVLEDNLRVPSGLAYAVQARRLLAAVMPELDPGAGAGAGQGGAGDAAGGVAGRGTGQRPARRGRPGRAAVAGDRRRGLVGASHARPADGGAAGPGHRPGGHRQRRVPPACRPLHPGRRLVPPARRGSARSPARGGPRAARVPASRRDA